eukprot:SAG25_NODE_92_length_16062_cov_54.931095_16_plen_106_part_00
MSYFELGYSPPSPPPSPPPSQQQQQQQSPGNNREGEQQRLVMIGWTSAGPADKTILTQDDMNAVDYISMIAHQAAAAPPRARARPCMWRPRARAGARGRPAPLAR